MDAASGKALGEIADTAGVHGIALAPALKRGFTSNGRARSVTVFDLDSLATQSTIEVTGDNPDVILYDAFSNHVITFNGRSANATVIDAETLKIVDTIALAGKPEFAVSDSRGRVFVNIEDKSELSVLDSRTDTIVATWPLSPCEEPSGLALDSIHQRLFSVCDNHKMVVVDATTGRIVADLPIGEGPDGVGYDPDYHMAFSSNGEGTLTVVHEADAEHFDVVANIATQKSARTMVVDPATHRLYLPAAELGPRPSPTAEQPHPRAPIVPGTFTVLVVSP